MNASRATSENNSIATSEALSAAAEKIEILRRENAKLNEILTDYMERESGTKKVSSGGVAAAAVGSVQLLSEDTERESVQTLQEVQTTPPRPRTSCP